MGLAFSVSCSVVAVAQPRERPGGDRLAKQMVQSTGASIFDHGFVVSSGNIAV